MPVQSFVFDGVTYYVRYLRASTSGVLSFDLTLEPGFNSNSVRIPDKLRDGATLVFGGGAYSRDLADAEDGSLSGILWRDTGINWSANQQIEVKLTFFDQEKYERDLRKGASRSGACGEDTTNSLENDEEGDTPGLWHCHGDGTYHYHADWRKAHNPHIAPEDLTPTPDPDPVPRPPATAPAGAYTRQKAGAPAIETEGFGNWHSHPDGRFHRHAGGH